MPRVNDYGNRTPAPPQPATKGATATATGAAAIGGATTGAPPQDHVVRGPANPGQKITAPPAGQPQATAEYRGRIGAPAPANTSTTGGGSDDGPTPRYGNQLQQAGGTQRHEGEVAVQMGPGDHHAQFQTTVANRVQLPVRVAGQPTDFEGGVSQTTGANPSVTGGTITLHTGPSGETGTGLYVGAGRNAQVGTDISRDRNPNTRLIHNSYTVSPTLVRSIGAGAGRRLDLQGSASATFGTAQNAGRPEGATYAAAGGFQMNQKVGENLTVFGEAWAGGSVSPNGDASARVGTGIGVQVNVFKNRVVLGTALENQTEVGGGGQVKNTSTVTGSVGIKF
jgi:hypothetical protein